MENDKISKSEYWNDIYSGKVKAEPGGNEHYRYGMAMKYLEGESIVDIGAGYCGLCKIIKDAYPEKYVLALDMSESAMKSSNYQPYKVSSIYSMPFPTKSFDMALCMQVLEYVEDNDAAIKEVQRIAKRGIFTVTNGKHKTCSQLREYNLESFVSMLSAYGEIEHSEYVHAMLFVKIKFNEV